MSVRTLHRAALTGTATLGVLGVLSGSTLLLVAGLALIAVMVATSGQLLAPTRSRGRAALTHGATLLGLGLAAAMFRTSRIDAVLLVVLLGIFNRFVLRAGSRDDFIIAGAASVLMAATTTITPGVAFALLIGAFIPAVLWALWGATLLGAGEEAPEATRQATLQRLAAQAVPRQRAFIAWTSLVFTGLGYVVMSLFPRYNFGRLLSAGYFMALPGASSQMELTNDGVSGAEAGAVVLRVEPNPDAPGASLEGLYARAYALDTFDGRTWSVGRGGAQIPLYPPEANYRGTQDVWLRDDGVSTVKVSLERLVPRDQNHPLIVLGRERPGYLKVPQPNRLPGGTVLARFRLSALRLTYKVDLAREAPEVPLSGRFAPREAALTELPEGLDPRLPALAERLTAGLEAPGDKIKAVLGHFASGYTYDLGPQEGESPDPLARFVFESKKGHCELYAGAVAVLLRLAGLKARVASGYYGGWWNSSGGYLEMSQQDAHAWVEVYDPARGWRWVDATPESLRSRRDASSITWLSDLIDAVEAAWFANVIDFDDRKRRALLGAVADGLGDLGGGLMEEGSAGPGRGAGGSAGLLAALLVLGLLGAGAWALRRRREGPAALGLRLRDALAPTGAPHLPLARLAEAAPEGCRGQARAVVAAYEALRFDLPARAPPLAEVRAAVAALERALRAARRARA